jgi:hypothetical protein
LTEMNLVLQSSQLLCFPVLPKHYSSQFFPNIILPNLLFFPASYFPSQLPLPPLHQRSLRAEVEACRKLDEFCHHQPNAGESPAFRAMRAI